MTRYQLLYSYGLMIILSGVCLVLFQFDFSVYIQYTIAVLMLVGTVFAILTALRSRKGKVQFKYHELHAIGMAVYGLTVLFFSSNVSSFLSITSLFLIYYGLTELIFCFWLFNLKAKLGFDVILSRLAVGFLIYISAVLVLTFSMYSQVIELMGYGLMFIISGVHVMFYRSVLVRMDFHTPPDMTPKPGFIGPMRPKSSYRV